MEHRTLQQHRPRLVRSADGKTPSRIEGYSAVYYRADNPGTEYELFRYANFRAVERLMPGCFDRAIREDDVRALFNHDASLLLGRTSAGTCKLTSDAMGLRYSITPPDATYAKDLMACLQRGDVTGSSFSFDYQEKVERDILNPDGSEVAILEVHGVKLYDVGPVTFPAYTSTTAEARKQAFGSSPASRRGRADQVERELQEFSRRLRGTSPQGSRRTRREKVRERAKDTLERLRLDEVHQQVEAARRLVASH